MIIIHVACNIYFCISQFSYKHKRLQKHAQYSNTLQYRMHGGGGAGTSDYGAPIFIVTLVITEFVRTSRHSFFDIIHIEQVLSVQNKHNVISELDMGVIRQYYL